VVDDWKAHMWSVVLPNVKVRSDLVLRADAKTGWAIRKDSPKLKAAIDDFFRNWAMKQGVADYSNARLYEQGQGAEGPDRQCGVQAFRGEVGLV